jgi:hypothetical protein
VKKELLNLAQHLSSTPVFSLVRVVYVVILQCCLHFRIKISIKFYLDIVCLVLLRLAVSAYYILVSSNLSQEIGI